MYLYLYIYIVILDHSYLYVTLKGPEVSAIQNLENITTRGRCFSAINQSF